MLFYIYEKIKLDCKKIGCTTFISKGIDYSENKHPNHVTGQNDWDLLQ